MNSVATIVVKKDEAETLESALVAARSSLVSAGANVGETIMLAEGEAADIPFDNLEPEPARAAVQETLQTLPADYCISPTNNRRKKLLLADMDSTIIEVECIDELADMIGLKDQIAPITEAAMRGEIDFGNALKKRVGLLEGLDEEKLLRVYQDRVRLSEGARELIAVMRAGGAKTVLVSGGFTFFTERIRDEVGFDAAHSNQLEILDGRLSGQLLGSIMDANQKRQKLLDYCAELKIDRAEAMALGDGANDLLMMQDAGLAISYGGKPTVEKTAHGRIRHTSLISALFFQGIRAEEIENVS